MALLIDISSLTPVATDAALEYIYKSNAHGGDGIWEPHDSPFIRQIIELFTKRGLDRFDAVKTQLLAWQNGDHFKGGQPPGATPPGMFQRWNAAEMELAKLYLESLPLEKWSLDDHMLSVEYVVQKYLPHEQLHTEAEWLAVRSNMMGKVQANITSKAAEGLTMKQVERVLAGLPSTVPAAIAAHTLNVQQAAALQFGAARAVENVVALADTVRHQMRNTIMQHVEAKQLQMPGTPGQSLEAVLFDKFATLNRDWRRIAVTEAGECQTQGYIASLPHGAIVKRVEQYDNACGFCTKINGRTAEVVSPSASDKDGNTQIWVGKNNIGRSASPRKRVGDVLVPREEHELYWLPAGLAHPHCRGRWVLVSNPDDVQEGDDPEFAAELRAILGS